jgi:hypothetical protein
VRPYPAVVTGPSSRGDIGESRELGRLGRKYGLHEATRRVWIEIGMKEDMEKGKKCVFEDAR